MGFRGNFRQVSCQRLGGKMWSFELTNTYWIRKSTYNIAIYDANRQQPWFWRGQVLDSGKTVAFNYDTVDWLFCQGDTVVLLDDNDPVLDPHGPQSGSKRVIRGGSYSNEERTCWVFWRGKESPSRSFINVGFRLAMNA